MKNVLLVLAGAVLLTGCMHSYDMVMVGGFKIAHISKPKLDKKTGLYSYTDAKGEKRTINASRVVEISPTGKP